MEPDILAGKKQTVTLHGNIVTKDEVRNGYIQIEDGVICNILDFKPEGDLMDFGDSYIVPGFIDLHTHGIHYFRVDHSPGDLSGMCQLLPQYGVTGFLPTVTPRPKGEDADFLKSLSTAKTEGAAILGFHIEGPFLKLTGGLRAETISTTDISRAESLIRAAKPYRAIFSISPDLEGIEKLLPLISKDSTPVFMTHTAATVEQTQTAIELGVSHATHFYDVFHCPPVQEPGVRPCGAVEAVLAEKSVSVDFILDGVHVDPVAVKVALACKREGPGRVCLITDSNMGAGLKPGRYTILNVNEIEFEYMGGPARRVNDKALSGSGLTMDQALRNAVKWLDIGLPDAVKLVSTNPAEVIGLGNRKGMIDKGYDADVVILDNDLNVLQTWIAGKICYQSIFKSKNNGI